MQSHPASLIRFWVLWQFHRRVKVYLEENSWHIIRPPSGCWIRIVVGSGYAAGSLGVKAPARFKGILVCLRNPLRWVLKEPLIKFRRRYFHFFAFQSPAAEIEGNLKIFYGKDILETRSFNTKPSTEEERSTCFLERSADTLVACPWRDKCLHSLSN